MSDFWKVLIETQHVVALSKTSDTPPPIFRIEFSDGSATLFKQDINSKCSWENVKKVIQSFENKAEKVIITTGWDFAIQRESKESCLIMCFDTPEYYEYSATQDELKQFLEQHNTCVFDIVYHIDTLQLDETFQSRFDALIKTDFKASIDPIRVENTYNL